MADQHYITFYELAVQELSELMREREELEARRDELNARIAQVREAVLSVSPLAGVSPDAVKVQYPHLFPDFFDPDTGLTDAIRKVLRTNGKLMTPVGVRTGLRTLGFDIDGRYKNALASIHTVLKRLKEAGEVEEGTLNDTTAYRWKGKPLIATQGVDDGGLARPTQRRGGTGGDPPPVGTVPFTRHGAGSGMSAMEQIIEDEKADLERANNNAMNQLIRGAANKKKGALQEAYEKLIEGKKK